MDYKVIEPADPVLSAAVVRTHLKVGDEVTEAEITQWVKAAMAYAQANTGRPVGEQTIRAALPCFPAKIKLPLSPVAKVKSITYVDSDGVVQTLPASAYVVNTFADPTEIVPAYGTSWPATRAVPNAVLVNYVASLGEELPADLQIPLLLLIGHYERNRTALAGAKLETVPLGVQAHLDNLRQYDLG